MSITHIVKLAKNTVLFLYYLRCCIKVSYQKQMQTDTALNLIGQIYDSASDSSQWPQFLENLTKATGAEAARMRFVDKTSKTYNIISGFGHDRNFDQNYHDYFSKVDLLNPYIEKQPLGSTFESHLAIPCKELKKSEIYNDLFKHYDIHYGLGGNIFKRKDILARIGLHRAYAKGPFNNNERDLVKLILPHLQRAFELGAHLEEMRAQLDDMHTALYGSSIPLILIDEALNVAFMNRQAENFISDENGLFIRGNRLYTAQTSEQSQLTNIISQAVLIGAGKSSEMCTGMRVCTTSDNERFNIFITPYPPRTTAFLGHNKRICAAIFIHKFNQKHTLPAGLLCALYGLTPSEIRLAENVLNGLLPNEIATKHGVSVNTIRSQLRSLFAKTETQRQAELVRLLSGLTGIV